MVLADAYRTAVIRKHDGGKTKLLIVVTELGTVRMTNVLSAQHIQRKMRGSDSGVVEDPFPGGIFSVTSVK
jgi:hypothetical protein